MADSNLSNSERYARLYAEVVERDAQAWASANPIPEGMERMETARDALRRVRQIRDNGDEGAMRAVIQQQGIEFVKTALEEGQGNGRVS